MPILYNFQLELIQLFVFYFFRTSLDKLEKISQTDIACVWSTQKKEAQEKYKAVPLYEMPCFEDKTEEVLVDANISKKIYSNLLSAMPVSSAALHK